MRSALLAACALVVAAPAWAQEPLDPKDAETLRTMAEQLERMKIIRCEHSSGLYDHFLFWKSADGTLDPVLKWPAEQVKIEKDRVTFITADSVLVVTPRERIEVSGDRVERTPCTEIAEDLAWHFRDTVGPVD